MYIFVIFSFAKTEVLFAEEKGRKTSFQAVTPISTSLVVLEGQAQQSAETPPQVPWLVGAPVLLLDSEVSFPALLERGVLVGT